MIALKAHVKDGRIELDEPAELPEGAELDVYCGESDSERAKFLAELEESIAQANAGELIDEDEVLAELLEP